MLFDHSDGNRLIFEESVPLSYDAIFGPDVGDVDVWQRMAIDYVDEQKKKNGF